MDKHDSQNLVLEYIKGGIANQREQVNALDSKANFILVSATALISAALVLLTVTHSSPKATTPIYCPIPTNPLFYTLPLPVLLGIYLCVLFSAYFAYKNRAYEQAPDPDELYKTYLLKEENETKKIILKSMHHAYTENKRTIRKKLRILNAAFFLLEIETLALIAFILFQTTC